MLDFYYLRGLEGFNPPTRGEEKPPWMAATGLNPGLENRNRRLRFGRQVLEGPNKKIRHR